jgi:hypothetical protein
MSEKKNFQLKNEEMESKKLDVDKLEQVNGGFIIEEDKKSNAKNKNEFILEAKLRESNVPLNIKITD